LPGDEVITVPKNPLTSSTLYGLAILLITAAVKKWVPPMFQDQTVKAALELLGYGIGAAIVLYGRWTANRALGFGDVKQTVIKLRTPHLSAKQFRRLYLNEPGPSEVCNPTQTATIANDSYTTTMQLFIQAYKAGWVSKDFLQNKVDPIRQKVNKALDDLNAVASGGSGNGPLSDFTVAWNAFQKVYQDLLATFAPKSRTRLHNHNRPPHRLTLNRGRLLFRPHPVYQPLTWSDRWLERKRFPRL
jgi:hypothetical protein